MSAFEVHIGRPRWARFSALAWLARVLGLDHGWAARADTSGALGAEIERLADARGLPFRDLGDGLWSVGSTTFTVNDTSPNWP